jgi:CHAT domain-containing protein
MAAKRVQPYGELRQSLPRPLFGGTTGCPHWVKSRHSSAARHVRFTPNNGRSAAFEEVRKLCLDVQSLAETLPQLPGTRVEVEKIAESLKVPKGDIKVGADATETAVKQSKLDDYRVVYFATHGLVAGELQEFAKAKAEPALALTIPDTPSDLDDGLLEASEVAALKINAVWVVLSACNIASSDGVGAEPLSGLARAFLYAGGKSLVVSHWDVSDDATVKLMANLFEMSKNKLTLSHGEMMRQSTLSLLNAATTDEDAHPRVWAPFVVVGEPARVR